MNTLQDQILAHICLLYTSQDFLTGGDDNIFGETKESCLAAIDKVLERIENPLAAVTEEDVYKRQKLDNRVVFYWDDVGTIPKIESAEMMFSASRSRRVSIVPMIQSLSLIHI